MTYRGTTDTGEPIIECGLCGKRFVADMDHCPGCSDQSVEVPVEMVNETLHWLSEAAQVFYHMDVVENGEDWEDAAESLREHVRGELK